ncbi:MAG: T9SS type A sorting domain-containing protein [Crocinitomix sp.]|nr:T9SS type A sorting domain-containing protein [Crocinitomix sp.]
MKFLSLIVFLIATIQVSAQCDSLIITAIYLTNADADFIEGEQSCTGDSLTLEATSTNDGDITWDLGVVDGEPFLPMGTGDIVYTATSSSPDDCLTSYEMHIHALDDVEVIATPDTICAGETTVFEVLGGWCEWDYGPVCGEEIYTGDPIAICETSTITGTAESMDTGCLMDASVLVVVNTLIASVHASDDSICLGEELILYGGIDDGGYLDPLNPIFPDYFEWSDDVEDSVAFTPETSGWYSVTAVSIEPSCEIAFAIFATVNSTEIAIGETDTLICIGDSMILTTYGGDTYSWDEEIIDGEPFYPIATEIYTVIGSNSETGCTDIASIEIVVSEDFPSVSIMASESLICFGEELILTASGADDYNWDGDVLNGVPFIEDEAGSITYNVVGTYLETGCADSANIEITVLEEVPITFLESDSICSGDSLLIFGSFQSEPGVYSDLLTTEIHGCDSIIMLEIMVHELSITPLELMTICAGDSLLVFDTYEISAGVYSDTLTSEIFGCDSILTRELAINDLPIVSFEPVSEGVICLNHPSVALNAEPSGGDFSGFGVSGTTFNPESAGEGSHWLFYAYEDDNGCTGVDSIMVTVSDCLGLNELEKSGTLVFPNPFSDYTTISFSDDLIESHTLIILNILGQEIYRNESVTGSTLEIKKEQLGVGVYILSLFNSDSEELFSAKLIVE